MFEADVDEVRLTGGERGQPHVSVVLSTIHSVYQVCHDPRVTVVFLQNVDVAGVRPELNRFDIQYHTFSLQCSDTVGWATARASSCK